MSEQSLFDRNKDLGPTEIQRRFYNEGGQTSVENSLPFGDSNINMTRGRLSGRITSRPVTTQNLSKTASRLVTGTNALSKIGQPILGITNIKVLERPITQQGVSGLRTAGSTGSQFRQVFDKRYYEGLIRMKMKDINTEISRLNGEIELETQQQAPSQMYEKKVREIASELTKLQGQLADYNLVIDKVNTSTKKSIVESESNDLRTENEKLSAELDQLYGQCRIKAEEICLLEKEIQNEKNVTLKLIEGMNESDREKYEEMKNVNENLLKEIENYQQQLDVLSNQKLEAEEKIAGFQIKRETVCLYHKLREREERKISLLEEERTRSTPAQEREKLLRKVKEDNAEIAAIDKQINQINEQIKTRKEELEIIEQDLEDNQPDKQQKFKELKKREETLEQFLSSFQEARNREAMKIDELEKKIISALEQISKNLKENFKPPGRDEFDIIKETLTLKEDELKRSKITTDELNVKRQNLLANLKKVEGLEKKIQEEIENIQEKTAVMNDELKVFSDIDGVKMRTKKKHDLLVEEKNQLNAEKENLKKEKEELRTQNEKLFKELNENETYVQLNNLEKKLQLLVQNNNSAKEFIESKKMEMEYEPLKEKALQSVHDYNQLLIANCAK